MGRGRSKVGGSGASLGSGGGTFKSSSFNTEDNVQAINEARKDGSRREIREAVQDIGEGQSVTIYQASMNGMTEERNVANDPVVWTKRERDYWTSDNGRVRTDSEMTSAIYNASYSTKVVAGAISTESRVSVTGRPGKAYEGLQYSKGTYDTYTHKAGDTGPKKYSQAGSITSYNGTQYGVARGKGGYTVTHVPTGLSTGAKGLKSMSDVSKHIKEIDKQISNNKALEDAARRFLKTVRGD